jgi:pimeloyl-ACP methyl ester carboxylesterase
MARDAVAVLDELGVERAHVGAASLGGMVAQEIALEFPERVSTLVLGSTTGGVRRLGLARAQGLLHLSETTLRLLRPASDPERRVSDFLCTIASEDFAAQCRPGDEAWDTAASLTPRPPRFHG